MIFARKSGDDLASLVKKLDKLVAKHQEEKLAAFVNFLGDDRDALEADAKEFGSKHEIEQIPLVVPVEFENGPENFGVNPDAEVTVTLYVGQRVVASHAFPEDGLDKKGIKAVLADVPKLFDK